MRPLKAIIRTSALQHNLQVVRRHSPSARIWAVVKSNAYGHGLAHLLPALAAQGAAGTDGLALLEFDAAEWLRDARIGHPILMLEGFFSGRELESCASLGLTTVVHAEEQVAMLARATLRAPVNVYFKLNTGMNRLGFGPRTALSALQRLRASRNVGNITIMTHFADADGPGGVQGQLDQLAQMLAAMPEAQSQPRSCANSAAILRYPASHADWVRPGIMLYGCTPFGDEPASTADSFGLQTVMTLRSEVLAVQEVAPGGRIGYGGTYTADRHMRIAIIAAGYADGYPRHAPGTNARGTPVLVGGKRTRTVGRVSMDLIHADITGLKDVGVGSEVTLWGDGLSADEVASAAGTVSYELLCALAPRVPVELVA